MNCVDEAVLRRELDSDQFGAARCVDGPSLILAGAGSGKTRALTYKIAHLIAAHRIPPERILAVTFTNKAAREMRERIAKLLGQPVYMPWMGTFHSICVRILRRCLAIPGLPQRLGWKYTGTFSIYDDSDQKRVLRALLRELYGDVEAGELRKAAGRISALKNKGVDPQALTEEALGIEEENRAALYAKYQQKLMDSNAMDFDDLLGRTVELLDKLPSVRDQFRDRLQYVFVDEYQDTNPVQYRLLQLLVHSGHNITVVGDDDQSIYGWRGADIGIIRSFKDDFRGVQIFKLERNYRSTSNIVSGAGAVIRNNPRPEGMDKRVYSLQEPGDPIRLSSLVGGDVEAERIAQRILEAGPDSYGHTAIFYRTNAQSRVLEEALDRRRIPLTIYGGVRFYDRKEVKDILCYLRLLVNPSDTVSLQRVFNVPRRGLGDTTWDRLESYAQASALPLGELLGFPASVPGVSSGAVRKIEALHTLLESYRARLATEQPEPLPSLVEALIADLGYREWLTVEDGEAAEDRLGNLNELISAMVTYDADNAGATLDQFLQEVALLTDADNSKNEAASVRMMTLHAAKGLEFDTVHLAGCDEGLLPLVRPGSIETPDEQAHRLEEERRLFYVGATRACKMLYLYSARSRKIQGRDERFLPSRFLAEIDPATLETEDLVPNADFDDGWEAPAYNTGGYRRNGGSFPGAGGFRGGAARGSFPAARGTAASSPRPWTHKFPKPAASRPSGTPVPRVLPGVSKVPQSTTPSQPQVVYDEHSQENLYFQPGCVVMHARFGRGKVLSCDGNDENSRVRVQFRDGTTKTLVLRYAGLQLVQGDGDAR